MVNGYNRPKEKAEVVGAINDIPSQSVWYCRRCGGGIYTTFQTYCHKCHGRLIWIVENGHPILCCTIKR